MASARRGEARRRHGRRLPVLALVPLGVLLLPAGGIAEGPTVEPAETASGYAWRPAEATAAPGGIVAFRNPGNVVPHGVRWTGGPEKPSCSGVPVDEFGTSWSGTCTFAQAGTYTFVCTVHPEEMKGTITVAAGEAPPLPAPGTGQPPAASEGSVVEALRVARRQHGDSVRGTVAVSSAAADGDLIVELRAARASVSGRGSGTVRVGELRRALAGGGRVAFAVRLRPTAQRALRRRGRLKVLVRTLVRPSDGAATSMTRRVRLSE